MKNSKSGARTTGVLETAAVAIGSTLGNLAKTVGLVKPPKKAAKKVAKKAPAKKAAAKKKVKKRA